MDFLNCWKIIKIIKNNKFDCIHSHFSFQHINLVCIINQITRIPYTFTAHAADIFIDPNRDIKKWATKAKKVITISKFNKEYMNKKLGIPRKKIDLITCGINLKKIKPIKKYKQNPFRIISISRLIEKKGYPYLIKACKILKERKIKFICEIKGDGPERMKLKKLIQNFGLKDDIKLDGALTHNKTLEFIKKGSVFVLPCIKAKNNDIDGIPTVLMEAMAMAIPVISTKITGIPELIDNKINGIIVPSKNSTALAEAIIKIKNNKKFTEKIRKKSREKIIEKFNIDKNINKLIENWKKNN